MTIQTLVTFSDDQVPALPDTPELLDMLGDKEQSVALQLRELFLTVKDSIRGAVEREAELTIEITGSLEMKGSGGVQYLIFNVGGEATKSQTMKVTLATRISPQDAT